MSVYREGWVDGYVAAIEQIRRDDKTAHTRAALERFVERLAAPQAAANAEADERGVTQ